MPADTKQELFSVELEAAPEPALLARIAQRLAWVGAEPERFSFRFNRAGTTVLVEFLFSAPAERAELLVAQLQKVVTVSRVVLSPAVLSRDGLTRRIGRLTGPERPGAIDTIVGSSQELRTGRR